MVRQLPPGSDGLPIEIYCFTNTVAWVGYESIQADIFDHLYAILPEFKLRVFQAPAGYDLLGTGPNVDRRSLPNDRQPVPFHLTPTTRLSGVIFADAC